MKLQIALLITAFFVINETTANCGCLKLQCSKDLQVVSPPHYPYKIIIKSPLPLPAPPPLSFVPPINVYQKTCPPVFAYRYQVQAPLVPPPPPPSTLTGLVAKPDRVVIQNTNCPGYIEDGACDSGVVLPPALPPALPPLFPAPAPPLLPPLFPGCYPPMVLPAPAPAPLPILGPILEPINSKTFQCDCRYDHRRKKRDLPILRHSVRFLVRLLPSFFRIPLESFLVKEKVKKPPETLLEKLQKVNREKRALVLDSEDMKLPFLRVTEIENDLEDESEEEEEEIVGRSHSRNEYLEPLNFDQMFPHNPIFYLLNAPIRFLRHFHKLGQQISPVFRSVPHVFVNSRQYLRKLGKNLRNDVLSIASDLIGDFDGLNAHKYHYLKPRRFRRSLEYQPDYSLVFGNQTEKTRKKRYILKVVDEDEVEQFLKEKLGDLTSPPPPKQKEKETKKKQKERETKKKLVVEQLSSKVIIDNNGRPFAEIDGVKRPLFLNRKKHEPRIKRPLLHHKLQPKEEEEKEEEEENTDLKDKINSLILKARERLDQTPPIVGAQQNVPNQMIKDRINQIFVEIQDLINIDFDKYSTIHGDLRKLESFKELLVSEWKKILMENKSNDIASKIRLLDDFKEMQILRDKAVEEIAATLSSGSSFMTKKLIKMLVRLQKLQCVIYRVVEDFDERIKMGTDFDERKEIRYVDYLSGLQFVVGRTQQDLEDDLRSERDVALENEMKILESLRKMLEENQDNPQKLYEEAQLLWEIKNIDKLQKDTIVELNTKISRSQKVRKELKILFDLLRQLENCEEKQEKLLNVTRKVKKEEEEEEVAEVPEVPEPIVASMQKTNKKSERKIPKLTLRNRRFPHKTILEDKKPHKLVSNGYTMMAYKVSDGFD